MATDKKPYLFIFNEFMSEKKMEYQLTPLKSIFDSRKWTHKTSPSTASPSSAALFSLSDACCALFLFWLHRVNYYDIISTIIIINIIIVAFSVNKKFILNKVTNYEKLFARCFLIFALIFRYLMLIGLVASVLVTDFMRKAFCNDRSCQPFFDWPNFATQNHWKLYS